jgi:hypothetical protein
LNGIGADQVGTFGQKYGSRVRLVPRRLAEPANVGQPGSSGGGGSVV